MSNSKTSTELREIFLSLNDEEKEKMYYIALAWSARHRDGQDIFMNDNEKYVSFTQKRKIQGVKLLRQRVSCSLTVAYGVYQREKSNWEKEHG